MLSERQEYINGLNERIELKNKLLRLQLNPDFKTIIEEEMIKKQTDHLILQLNTEAAFTVPGHKDSTVAHLTAISFVKSFFTNILLDGESAEVEKKEYLRD